MRKPMVFLILALALTGLTTGCEPPPPTAAPQAVDPTPTTEPTTFTYPDDDWGYPTPFAMYPRGPGYLRMSYLFDTLTWKDENGIIPWLADSWQVSEDGTRWTFELHPGVNWHDGQPLTAGDVVFSFEYFKENQSSFTWTWPVDKLEKAEVVDDDTVTVHLTEPVADIVVDLFGSMPIIPRHIWQDVVEPNKFLASEAVVGSGPFTLVEYTKEEGRYIYAANAGYFKGKPAIDRLIFITVQDAALALKTGTVDAASFWGKEIAVVKEFESDARYEIKEGPSFWLLQITFNTARAPFDALEARQAVAHAIDRAKIVEQVTQGGAVVANLGIVSPRTEWAAPELVAYTHDPERARQILSEIGAADASITLITTANFAREAQLVQVDLEQAGLTVEIKTGDQATVDGLLKEGNFDLAINGHGGTANPSILRTPTWPAQIYENERYDDLFARQSETVDETERRELVWQLQEILAQDLPVLPLYHPKMWAIFETGGPIEPIYTAGGIGFGIPIELNKLIFLER